MAPEAMLYWETAPPPAMMGLSAPIARSEPATGPMSRSIMLCDRSQTQNAPRHRPCPGTREYSNKHVSILRFRIFHADSVWQDQHSRAGQRSPPVTVCMSSPLPAVEGYRKYEMSRLRHPRMLQHVHLVLQEAVNGLGRAQHDNGLARLKASRQNARAHHLNRRDTQMRWRCGEYQELDP